MMFFPFLTAGGALVAAVMGKRGFAIALWALTALSLIALFRYHATSALDLQF